MLEILQFYVSGFWIWLGITIALSIVVSGSVKIVAVVIVGLTGITSRERVNFDFRD